LLLVATTLSSTTTNALNLGAGKKGNMKPGLDSLSLAVANNCPLTATIAKGQTCLDIASQRGV
ncbi:hypothetical protein HDU76_011847, partial [Blyttiomyces sp. JEL0837]